MNCKIMNTMVHNWSDEQNFMWLRCLTDSSLFFPFRNTSIKCALMVTTWSLTGAKINQALLMLETRCPLPCYRVCAPDVIKFSNPKKRATKGFVLIRHERYQVYTCLQLSSSVASFFWKPAHFELRSYGGAWHNTKIAFVKKYTLISWFLTILGV